MRTDEFTRMLASDAAVVSLERRLAIALIAGMLLSAVLFAVLLGPREDLAAAAATLHFLLKPAETLLLVLSAALVLLRCVRPGMSTAAILLLCAPAVLVASVVVELLVIPASQWETRLIGTNSLVCLTYVPILAAPPLVAILAVLRAGAPTRPAVAGLVAGLVAGGAAAALYAVHCFDDSPLFVATWYTLAILIVAVVGAAAGSRILRW
jgi:hypothetical protein